MEREKSVSHLLDNLRLREGGDSVRATYRGRAVSKGDDSLHLAVESGLLSIPVRDIENVTPLSMQDPTVVQVDVCRAEDVKHIVTVTPPATSKNRPEAQLKEAGIFVDPAARMVDTVTITGGRPDATDDSWDIDIVIIVGGW